MALKFNPSSTKETNYLLELLSKFALQDWQNQQELGQYKKKLQLQRDIGLENLAKYKGLYPEAFGQEAGVSTDPFAKQDISRIYPKGLDLETGMPQIGIRTPREMIGEQHQQDIGRFKAAEQEYGLGEGMTKEKFTLMPREERASFIRNRLANFPGARATMKELRPRFEGKEFVQDVEGRYKEMPPQAITDAEGNIIGYRPKGAAFQPKGEGKGKTLIAPMIDKISKSEDAYYTLGDAAINLQANKDRFAQFMGPGKGALRHPIRSYVNKDLQDFLGWKANVQDAFQQYRVVITGAQASDKEIALLAKNRPTENDTYDVFMKKTNEVRRIGNQVLSRYIKNLGKAGYNISGYQDALDNLNAELGRVVNETKVTNKVDLEYQKYLQAIGGR